MTLYYEDFAVGETFECDGERVTEADVVAFAEQYDPLGFHVDRAAAERSIHGGLIASGIHTLAISQRQVVRRVYGEAAIQGSLGMNALRFPRPVRPGDVLSTRLTVLEKRVSKSDPSRGVISLERVVENQADEEVLALENAALFARRSAD